MNNIPNNISEIFGENVFNDSAMRMYLPVDTYKMLKKTIDNGHELDSSIADSVANGMKQWAISKGATHFTHWFQPLTGATAEKHDSFINPDGDGNVIMTFSGKELIKGEADASSFPSGGLRVTFEARGYTMWDCTSPVFIKENTLCIPTCFCSFTGEVLDKKTPLLRSMEILSKSATRVVNALGITSCSKVVAMCGAEQEYFLIDKEYAKKRRDILLCGRTLFGAKTQKGQELSDHYYGNIKENVVEYMRELDEELWKLGVTAKTEHNEAAPCQHELAPVYATCNIACDHNQLMMEMMKKVALRKGMVCLLHEKPFEGVNGSGKHNNWSLNIDGGKSLLKQSKNPASDIQFLLFLTSVIKAVDKYSELLLVSIASAGNDHRLGGHEAPPAIVSIFLGETLTNILESIEQGNSAGEIKRSYVSMGINTIPALHADNTDRNRTSPFAFTGNKFEFRMPGSSQSIADCNTIINTIVADVLFEVADRLEKAEDPQKEALKIIADIMREHKRIIFNGNNYSNEWVVEAKKRGLPVLSSTVEAIASLTSEKNIKLFEKHGILSKKEMESRAEIYFESYVKTLNIEALTMIDMVKRDIVPSLIEYQTVLADSMAKMAAINAKPTVQSKIFSEISQSLERLDSDMAKLEDAISESASLSTAKKKAEHYRYNVYRLMEDVRKVCDRCETIVPEEIWRLPTYTDIMYK